MLTATAINNESHFCITKSVPNLFTEWFEHKKVAFAFSKFNSSTSSIGVENRKL